MSKDRTYQFTMKDGELISVEEISEDSVASSLPLDTSSNPTKDDDNDSEVRECLQ
jgi:hypothetical protein